MRYWYKKALRRHALGRRSTATGFIGAPRMLRQGCAHIATVEPKCRHSTRFTGGKPHGTTITMSFTYFTQLNGSVYAYLKHSAIFIDVNNILGDIVAHNNYTRRYLLSAE